MRRGWLSGDVLVYSDLNRTAINNLAEFAQPMKPGEPGYDEAFEKQRDFSHVIVVMPQSEVMNHGYGRHVTPYNFPIVFQFLTYFSGSILDKYHYGAYSFPELVMTGFAKSSARTISRSLYDPFSDSGEIDKETAAYVHGTVGFALMSNTRFIYSPGLRRVDAEIGALDDNWDFESSSPLINLLNPFVKKIAGPSHLKITKPIIIRYRGNGRRLSESLIIQPISRPPGHGR